MSGDHTSTHHHTFMKLPFSRRPQGAPDSKLIQRKVERSQEGKWEE